MKEKIEKENIIKTKSEKGAITLFVLIACLFFVFTLTGVYISNVNRMKTQEQDIKQIQENYKRELDNIDEVYEEIASDGVTATLTAEPEEWTQKVTLKGTGEVKEGKDIEIVKYAFTKDQDMPLLTDWKDAEESEKIKIEKTEEVTEGGKYTFWVKDAEGNIYKSNELEVKNIDKTLPTPGSIIAKKDTADGEEYEFNKWTDTDVYVEKVNGTDGESGHKSTTITVQKNGITMSEYTNVEGPITLTENGTYTITVTTEDNAGNKATSEPYIVKIDKVIPILALKHNDASGADYEQGTWTKDNLYGEITIDTSSTGKTVEKYQYSYNGITWDDISAKTVPTSLDYTTTFPMGEDKPDWISGPTNNGTYYFEVQEDGTLKPNNSGVNSKTANSYFELDLTDYPDAELELTINATISSESGYDYGYATITTTTTAPAYNSSTGQFIKVSGSTKTADYTTTITGGQKYYLHVGYRKDSSQSSNQDTFIINSITLKSDALGKTINFYNYNKQDDKISFTLQDNIDEEIYIRAVYNSEENDTSRYTGKQSIKIDKIAPVIESAEPVIISKTDAKINVKVVEDGSGLKGYYISKEDVTPTEQSTWTEQILKEFTIEGLSTETTYYLWTIDSVGNISEKQDVVIGKVNYLVDNSAVTLTLEEAIAVATDGSTIQLLNDYIDTSTATFSKNITFDLQSYTLTRQETISISSGKTVEITGTGKITTESNYVRTVTNSGILTLSNSITIENASPSSSDASIYSGRSSITNINDDVKIIGYYNGIHNYGGTVNINGGYIEATYQYSSVYAIFNDNNSSRTYVKSGEIRGYYGIYNSNSSILEITDGTVVGTGAYGIYAYGTTNIYGGRIEGKTYGLYSTSSDKITFGRQEDELSITIPAVYGETYGIYLSDETYSFNFYNGKIISNTKETAYRGQAILRTGHMPYTYFDYDTEQRYCTILTPTVENIKMEATPTGFTNGNVTVKITYPYNIDTKQYSENGIDWKDVGFCNEEVIVNENKTIYARTINESGMVTDENQIVINNIDKEKPTVTVTPTQTNYAVTETNGTVDLNITITAQDTGVSGLNVMQYAWTKEGEEPKYIDFNNTITIDKTKLGIGQYNLYLNVTDKAGNKADLVQMRYNVKYQEPVAQIGDTKYLTIQDAVEACSKNAIRIEYEDLNYKTTFPMSGEKPEWISGPTNNGTYYFEVQEDGTLKPNNSGKHSTTANSCFEIDLSKYPDIELEIEINATISSENNYDFGYATITTSKEAPQYNSEDGRFIYKSGSTNTADYTTTIKGGKKYYVHIGYRKDSSSNSNQDTFIINSIKTKGEVPKQIVEEPTTIIILKNTDEEFSTYEGQNIILDLKGNKIGSSSIETPICTNNGRLQIVDTSTNQTGKLESLNGTAIQNNGELTIGDNSTNIENNTPTIYGYRIGIENNNIFNFYDGKIQGITPIKGKTTDTPTEYGPVSTEYNNGITTVQLGIVSGYEARIGWVYYTTVQEAVDAVTTNVQDINKDTVTIIKDIQLKKSLNISLIKKIILDLNGYTLTVIEQDTVIENYGELWIEDSSDEKTGNITISSSKSGTSILKIYTVAIKNNNGGNLTVSGGTINSTTYSSYNYACGIYNIGNGTIIVTEGIVNTNDSVGNAYGIYNNNNGTINVTGGIVSCSNSSNMGYGIYNNNNGTINVTGGIVSCSNSQNYSYGIYNKSGKIEIAEGIVECNGSNADLYVISNSSGTVKLTGGMIRVETSKDSTYGIYNYSGTVNILGGNINILCDDGYAIGYGIHNSGPGTVIVEGGTINVENMSTMNVASSNGICNAGEGIINLIGGTINSTCGNISRGLYNADKGKIIIGDASKQISKENPKITSQDIGIYNYDGNVEFYNGIIQGNKVLEGTITKVRDNYKIESSIMNGTESIYLIEKTYSEYIVQVDEKKYYSLQDAINSIKNNEEKTIQILKDFELEENIELCKNIILDLNGHIITNKYYKILNTGNLNITDSTEDAQGKIECIETMIGIVNDLTGNITISRGTIQTYSREDNYGIVNYSSGNVIIEGGIISCESSENGALGVDNLNNGTVKLIEGIINSTCSNDNYMEYCRGIYNYKEGKVEMTGGTINVSGGQAYGIDNFDATVRVTGGTINVNGNYEGKGINIESSKGNGVIEGGTINSIVVGASSSSAAYGIRVTGTLKVTGGIINTSCSNQSSYGIYNRTGGMVEVTGGTVNSNSSKQSSYGIYNSSTGTIILGIKEDGMVSQEKPMIKGTKESTSVNTVGYGIYNIKGKLYFYDGKIEGTTKAVYEIITEKEKNTEFNYNDDETILTLSTEQLPIAQIGNITYMDLQEAINSVTEANTTIKILRNITYTNESSVIVIQNTKNIILDLNGCKITSSILGRTIQNEGKLEIIDTSENKTGLITTSERETIKNIQGADLTITGGTINNKNKYAISNSGKVVIQGGTVNNTNNECNYNDGYICGIYNASKGIIEMTGGTVDINSNTYHNVYICGIWNESNEILKIEGGVISSRNTGSAYACGIYNANIGIIEITGGIINSSSIYRSYGVYNASAGTLIVGTKNDKLVSQEEPLIKAINTNTSSTSNETYGIYNPNGTLYYYDGKIQGTDRAIYGNLNEIEDLTELVITTETVDEEELQTLALEQTANAVIINETEYDSLSKAIKASGSEQNTIKLLRDVGPGADAIIELNQNIIIDLNGYTLSNYNEITNNGTLKIIDTSSEQTGKIIGTTTGIAISNTGTMELNSGTITDSTYGIKNTGTLNITGGKIENNTYGIYNDANGNTIITNGEITSNTYGIYNYASTSTTNINDGTISSNEYGVYNYNGTTNITSSGITSNTTYGIYNAAGTTNIKEGSQVQSQTGIYVANGTVNIGEQGTMNPDSPIIIGENFGLEVSSTGVVYMYDGQIKGKQGATQGFITHTETAYTVANKVEGEYFVDYLALAGTISTVAEVNGVSYSNLQSAINSVVGSEPQTVKLTNGIISTMTFNIAEGQNIILDMNGKTISSDLDVTMNNEGTLVIIDSASSGVAKISSTVGTVINNTGTLILGQDDGTVSQDAITIEGQTYGITTSGTLSFYDGTINGASAVNGTVTNRPSGYVIRTTTVNGKERYYLSV